MPTTVVEKLGALHTENYADFTVTLPNGTRFVPGNFEELVLLNLKNLENDLYLVQPNIARGIHGEATPTIGYGFDLRTFGTWAEVRQVLVYGLGGEANLTQLQRDGLDILRDYRSGIWTDADIQGMAGNNTLPSTWSDGRSKG